MPVLPVTGVVRPEGARIEAFRGPVAALFGEPGTGELGFDRRPMAPKSSIEVRKDGKLCSTTVQTSAETVLCLMPGSDLADFCTVCPWAAKYAAGDLGCGPLAENFEVRTPSEPPVISPISLYQVYFFTRYWCRFLGNSTPKRVPQPPGLSCVGLDSETRR